MGPTSKGMGKGGKERGGERREDGKGRRKGVGDEDAPKYRGGRRPRV